MNNYIIKSTSKSLTDKKIEEIVKKHKFVDVNYTYYDLKQDSILSLLEDADTISFLSQNKVIIGTNLDLKNLSDSEINRLNKYLDNFNESVILIFPLESIDTRKKIVKEVVSKFTLVEIAFKALDIIKDMFKDYKVDKKIVNTLESYYSDDLERLISECNKLKLAFITDKNITYLKALDLIIKPLNNKEGLTFDLVREITLKNKTKALSIYNELISYNVESYSLLGLLESTYRLLYQVKVLSNKHISNDEMAKILDVHPFRVKKTLDLIAYYSLKEIRKVIKNLADIDYKIKSGIYENTIIIDLLILNI